MNTRIFDLGTEEFVIVPTISNERVPDQSINTTRIKGPVKPSLIPKIEKAKFDELMEDNRWYAQPMIRGQRLIIHKSTNDSYVLDENGFFLEDLQLEKTIEDMIENERFNATIEAIYAHDGKLYIADCLEYNGDDLTGNLFYDRYVFVRNLLSGLNFVKLPVSMNKIEKENIINDTRSYSRRDAEFGWQRQSRGIVFKFGSGRYNGSNYMFRYTTTKY